MSFERRLARGLSENEIPRVSQSFARWRQLKKATRTSCSFLRACCSCKAASLGSRSCINLCFSCSLSWWESAS